MWGEVASYTTPTISVIPNVGTKSKWLHNPAILGSACGQEGYRTPALLEVPCVGTKSEMATSPLPSWVPTCGQNGYTTPAVSGTPKRGGGVQVAMKPVPSLFAYGRADSK